MSKHLLALVICASLTSGASALELRDSRFEVTFNYANYDEHYTDALVPLLPDNACYGWNIQLPEGMTPKSVTERLILPVALADWGTLSTDPDDGVEISDDGTTATATLEPAPDADGRLSHGWCVAAGDPTGAHRMEVSIDGTQVWAIDFEVVAPEDYNWPSIEAPDPMARSVYNSW